jgi:hypothetical protein
MKIILILICGIFIFSRTFSQEQKPLYSGGMLFLQPGVSFADNPHQNIRSVGFGIGGLLRFYIKNNLTIGIIGGSQKTNYKSTNSTNSYTSLGYGGPFIGYTLGCEKFRFCAAISIGKGRFKNLHIENQESTILKDADYYSYPANIAYPMISFDYHMTKKISAVFQTICLMAQYNKNHLYFCPVLQIGVVFNR